MFKYVVDIDSDSVAGLNADDRRVRGVRLETGTVEADVVVLAPCRLSRF